MLQGQEEDVRLSRGFIIELNIFMQKILYAVHFTHFVAEKKELVLSVQTVHRYPGPWALLGIS